jgi:hypothetical protein
LNRKRTFSNTKGRYVGADGKGKGVAGVWITVIGYYNTQASFKKDKSQLIIIHSSPTKIPQKSPAISLEKKLGGIIRGNND